VSQDRSLILVTGATGAQGGATARSLLTHGFKVRFLTRNPHSAAAKKLIDAGAQAVAGDMDDPCSVATAMEGVYGVFSVQVPDSKGTDAERRHANTLVSAAQAAGVKQFVHTSVCEAGKHTEFPRWDSGYWWQKYWTDKWDAEEAVRSADFEFWTLLKPAFMMDNLAQPKAQYMFPHLTHGKIITALLPDTRMQLIAADDVGAVACAAFLDPHGFNQQNLDLAAQALTMADVAQALSIGLDTPVSAQSVSPDEAIAAGMFAGWVRSQEWTNEVGYRADIPAVQTWLKGHGITLSTLASWVERHAHEIQINR